MRQPAVEELYDRVEAASPVDNIDALIVDCSDVTKIGSSGLRALCLAQKDLMQRGQKMMVVGLTGDVRETFEISGMTALLHLCDDVETALGQCTGRTSE